MTYIATAKDGSGASVYPQTNMEAIVDGPSLSGWSTSGVTLLGDTTWYNSSDPGQCLVYHLGGGTSPSRLTNLIFGGVTHV